MDVLLPRSLDEALAMKAQRPEALPIAGGTDVMVELNFGRLRPPAFIDVSRVPELSAVRQENGQIFLGAGVTYAAVVVGLTACRPLVQASRSVGSPQIRNRGTVGGNLGTGSPAGDALPALAAYDAEIVLRSQARGERSLPWSAFITGPKKTAIAPDELILGARWRRARGPGSFSKIGTRNAMVIALAGLCLQVDEDARRVKVALGSVGPTIIRASEAEEQISAAMETAGTWQDRSKRLDGKDLEEFAGRVAAAARPLDDVRGTAAYRRHACQVLARRALSWALQERTLPAWL
jgi:CO/xanthine dehydrogenase FAD-binding subunit